MPICLMKNALGSHLLAELRDERTPPQQFRRLAKSISQLLVALAAQNLPAESITVNTPMESTICEKLSDDIVLVPILRAGLGMLDAALELLPCVRVGYLGLERDELTANAAPYYSKLPDVEEKIVFVLDPMLATGGSAAHALQMIYAKKPKMVKLVCIVAAPEGVNHLTAEFPELEIICASLDRELNHKKYIMPGLGDFGDRLYGT